MEITLTIIAALGVLLFLIGYLAFVLAGFRQNFITGIISALPVLNIVTVPALWHKTSKKLMISVLGIAITTASWFFGADANIKKVLFHSDNADMRNAQTRVDANASQSTGFGTNLSSPAINISQNVKRGSRQVVGTTVIRPSDETVSTGPFANTQRLIDESEMQELPKIALYKLAFETVPVNKVKTLKGRIIQLISNKNKLIEGRISRVSNSSIFLHSGRTISIENEFPIANIKQLRLMVKRQ